MWRACAARPYPAVLLVALAVIDPPGSAPTRWGPRSAGCRHKKPCSDVSPGAADVSDPQRVLGQYAVQADLLQSPALALVDRHGEGLSKRSLSA